MPGINIKNQNRSYKCLHLQGSIIYLIIKSNQNAKYVLLYSPQDQTNLEMYQHWEQHLNLTFHFALQLQGALPSKQSPVTHNFRPHSSSVKQICFRNLYIINQECQNSNLDDQCEHLISGEREKACWTSRYRATCTEPPRQK